MGTPALYRLPGGGRRHGLADPPTCTFSTIPPGALRSGLTTPTASAGIPLPSPFTGNSDDRVTTCTWSAFHRITGESTPTTFPGTATATVSLTRGFDAAKHLVSLNAAWGAVAAPAVTYGYVGAAGRLRTITSHGRTVTLNYGGQLARSSRSHAHGGATLLTTTRTLDSEGRMEAHGVSRPHAGRDTAPEPPLPL